MVKVQEAASPGLSTRLIRFGHSASVVALNASVMLSSAIGSVEVLVTTTLNVTASPGLLAVSVSWKTPSPLASLVLITEIDGGPGMCVVTQDGTGWPPMVAQSVRLPVLV